MTDLNEKEYENVLKLDLQRRMQYFIRKACLNRKIWALQSGGDLFIQSGGENSFVLSLWPYQRFAEVFGERNNLKTTAKDLDLENYFDGMDVNWGGYLVKEPNIRELMEQWLPQVKFENIKLMVFPLMGLDSKTEGVILSPEEFHDYLTDYYVGLVRTVI